MRTSNNLHARGVSALRCRISIFPVVGKAYFVTDRFLCSTFATESDEENIIDLTVCCNGDCRNSTYSMLSNKVNMKMNSKLYDTDVRVS
jgi:hypothetical protein